MPVQDSSEIGKQNDVVLSMNPLECLAQTAEHYERKDKAPASDVSLVLPYFSGLSQSNAVVSCCSQCIISSLPCNSHCQETLPLPAFPNISGVNVLTRQPITSASMLSSSVFAASSSSAFTGIFNNNTALVSSSNAYASEALHLSSNCMLPTATKYSSEFSLNRIGSRPGHSIEEVLTRPDPVVPSYLKCNKPAFEQLKADSYKAFHPVHRSVIMSRTVSGSSQSLYSRIPESPPALYPIDQNSSKHENLLDTLLQESRKILSPSETEDESQVEYKTFDLVTLDSAALVSRQKVKEGSMIVSPQKRVPRKRKPKGSYLEESSNKRSHMGPPFVPGSTPPEPNSKQSALCTLHEHTLLKMATRGFWSGDRGPLQDVFRLSRVETTDLTCSFKEITEHCYNVVKQKLEAPDGDLDMLHQYMKSYVCEFDEYLHRIYPVSSVAISIYLPTASDYARATWHGIVPTGWSEYRRAVVIREVFEIMCCFGARLRTIPKYESRFFDNPEPDNTLLPLELAPVTAIVELTGTENADASAHGDNTLFGVGKEISKNGSNHVPDISETFDVDRKEGIAKSEDFAGVASQTTTVPDNCCEDAGIPANVNRSRAFEAMWRHSSPHEPIMIFEDGKEQLPLGRYLERFPLETYCPSESTSILIDRVKYKASDVLGFFRRGVQLVDYDKDSRTAIIDTVSTVRKVSGASAVRKIPPGKISKLIHQDLHLENYTSTILPVHPSESMAFPNMGRKPRQRIRKRKIAKQFDGARHEILLSPKVESLDSSELSLEHKDLLFCANDDRDVSKDGSFNHARVSSCPVSNFPMVLQREDRVVSSVEVKFEENSREQLTAVGVSRHSRSCMTESSDSPLSSISVDCEDESSALRSKDRCLLLSDKGRTIDSEGRSPGYRAVRKCQEEGHGRRNERYLSSSKLDVRASSGNSSSAFAAPSSAFTQTDGSQLRAVSLMSTSDRGCQTYDLELQDLALPGQGSHEHLKSRPYVSVHTQTPSFEMMRGSVVPLSSHSTSELGRLSSLHVMVDSYRRAAQYLLDTANQLELVALGIRDEIVCKPEEDGRE